MRRSIVEALHKASLPVEVETAIADAVDAGLAAVTPAASVARGLATSVAQRQLRRWADAPEANLVMLSVGKAAPGMHAAVLGGLTRPPDEHLATTLDQATAANAHHTMYAEHPDPGAGALAVAAWARRCCARSRPRDLLITCISGGASSMMCGWDPAHHESIRALVAKLRARGGSIEELNTLRSAFDPLKRGGLRHLFHPGDTLTLVLSDTPFAGPGVVGSGPTIPAPREPVHDLLVRYGLEAPSAPAVIPPGDGTDLTASGASHVVVEVGDNETALAQVIASLRAGPHPVTRGQPLRGDAFDAGLQFARALRSMPPGYLVSGGECTTTIRGEGSGGRSMEFALGVAQHLSSERGALRVGALALVTDGLDGTSGAAGAVAHPRTVELLRARGLTISDLRARSDSANGLRAAGGLVESEPTGTNVADLVIGWRLP